MDDKNINLFDDESIEALVVEVIAATDEAENLSVDPFEKYLYRLQKKIFGDKTTLTPHCIAGYNALVREIKKEK